MNFRVFDYVVHSERYTKTSFICTLYAVALLAVSSFVDALSQVGYHVRVLDYAEHALSSGGDALAAAYVECEVGQGEKSVVAWGVATDANIVTASLRAVASAVDRAVG